MERVNLLFGNSLLHKQIALVLAVGVLIAAFLVGGSCAGSLSLAVPANTAEIGDVITIPVVIEDAQDIAGITIDVSNDVPGAVVTIDQNSRPLGSGAYMFNSKEDNAVQRVVWYSTSGFTADTQEIFSLQVRVTSPDMTEVPITITPVTLVNSKSGFLTETYPVTEVESFSLTDSVIGKIIYGKPASKAAVATSSAATTSASAAKSVESTPSYTIKPTVSPTSSVILPTQNTNAESSAGKLTGESTEVPTNVPSVPEPLATQGSPVSTQASPLGVFPLLGIGFAGLMLKLRRK